MEGLHLGTVVDKFDRNDAFARPWQSFDPLRAGDVIGTRANGEVVRAPHDGYIVFPNALAAHTRGPGLPRPGRELDPPSWADDIVASADRMLGATALADLSSVPEADLAVAVSSIAELEREVSGSRREVQRRMDRVQDEIVARYQAGASVDDLLI